MTVRARALLTSPVLVGRDELLTVAGRRLKETADGRGRLLLVAGEAGIGKTRLLASISRRAERAGFTILRASAFPGDAVAAEGLLLDLAGDLRRAPDLALQAAGSAMSRRLRDVATGDADPHRHHRLLVQDLADAVADLDDRRQLLIVLEDMHWADQLSLDVISRLAPRLATRATLVVGAYRNDELSPTTPMRLWRGRLLGQRLADELPLARLSLAETGVLSNALLGATVPTRVVAAIHDRSDGIPLHVEELIAAAGDVTAVREGDGGLSELRVPDTRCRRRSGSSLRPG